MKVLKTYSEFLVINGYKIPCAVNIVSIPYEDTILIWCSAQCDIAGVTCFADSDTRHCYTESDIGSVLTQAEIHSNEGMLKEDALFELQNEVVRIANAFERYTTTEQKKLNQLSPGRWR